MKKQENPGGSSEIITMLLACGAYLAYTYLQSSGLWAQWFGGAGAAATGGMPTLATIQAGLQSGAFAGAGSDASGNVIVHQVATGAYYSVNPATGVIAVASGPGGTPSPTTNTVPTTVPVNTPPPASNVQAQLQAMAQQFMQNTGAAGLNVDQWLYYWQIITRGANPNNIATFTVTPQQGESVIQALGLTDATRGTIVSMSQFLAAMNTAGVSGLGGIVMVPNSGPINNPLPSSTLGQSFNRGFGGYGKNGQLVRGNSYVQ